MELQVFNYKNNEVRTVEQEGQTWWALKDVCGVLRLSNPTVIANRLDDDEVTKFNLGGKSGKSNIVNESGLYNVILRSDKPEAKEFKRWVTHKVLPTIRKHGAYMTPETIEQAILNPDTIIQIATALKNEQIKTRNLQETTAKQQQLIGELKPKADYLDRILQSKSLVNITQIAKDYGMSGSAFNKLLHELKVQHKIGGQWLLYAKHQKKGYTSSETLEIEHNNGYIETIMRTKWTQKGRLFLYELLKKEGYHPMIEQELKTA